MTDGTLTLTAEALNYIVVDRSDGAISVSTSDAAWNDSAAYARVYRIDCGPAAVATVEDHRAGPGGVHGSGGGSMSLASLEDVEIGSPGPSDGDGLIWDDGLQAWVPGVPSANLANWADSINTATPNNPVPAARLTPNNAAANVDAVIAPKGDGALQGQTADGTATGGNKRGSSAVDLQFSRSTAAAVASGIRSAIVGGQGNTASGNSSFVGGGQNNTASGSVSTVHGSGNTASGQTATVAGGSANTASGTSAWVPGGSGASTRGTTGKGAYGSGPFSTAGDAQRGLHVVSRQFTSSSATPLGAGGTTPTATNGIVLPNGSAYAFRGDVIARANSTGDCAHWRIEGTIKRGANAAATALVGTPTVALVGGDSGASAWACTVVADTTYGGLEVRVTGASGTSVKAVAHVETVEVVG